MIDDHDVFCSTQFGTNSADKSNMVNYTTYKAATNYSSPPDSKLVKSGFNNILVIKLPMKTLSVHIVVVVVVLIPCEKKVTANQKCLDCAGGECASPTEF